MTFIDDRELNGILWSVFGLLGLTTLVSWWLRGRLPEGPKRAMAANLFERAKSYWVIALLFAATLLTGEKTSIALFAMISLLALREFLSLAPMAASDHRAMVWTFFIVTPLQYVLIAMHWYGFWSIFIPVYVFLFIPTLNAMVGDAERFLERTATLQWGLMVCVYCVSYAPALLWLRIPEYRNENAKLLMFAVLVVQLSDFLQYLFGRWLGRHKMAPVISPNKTWEGFAGGVLGSAAVGASLWWATPFSPIGAGVAALLLAVLGVAGGLTMSAIKRDRGLKDFGSLLPGHGGILDRIDSVCFSVPVFFHVVRFFYARGT